MKKKIVNIFIVFFMCYLLVEIILNKELVFVTVNDAFLIWKDNLVPSLFPFFIISEILINYDVSYYLAKFLDPLFKKIFKINANGSTILILSLLSGFPSNARNTRLMYDKGMINKKEAEKILTFSHFSNPLFILGTLATFYLKNKTLGIIILVSHYLGNFFIGIIFRNYYVSKDSFISFSKEKKYFSKIFLNAIYSCIKTLLLILGTLTCFLILSTVISYRLNLNSYHDVFLKGFLEVTSGLKALSNLNVPLIYKTVIATLFLSFGGFCVNMQVISQISDTDISYKPYFIARFMHLIISSFIAFILYLFVF